MSIKEELKQKRDSFWKEIIWETILTIKSAIEEYMAETNYGEEIIEFELAMRRVRYNEYLIDLNLFPVELNGEKYILANSFGTKGFISLNSILGVRTFVKKISSVLKEEEVIITETIEEKHLDILEKGDDKTLIKAIIQL